MRSGHKGSPASDKLVLSPGLAGLAGLARLVLVGWMVAPPPPLAPTTRQPYRPHINLFTRHVHRPK